MNTNEAKGVRYDAQDLKVNNQTVPGPLHLTTYIKGHLLTQAKT